MKRNGFTLIELLVVVAIIGILAAVGVMAYSGYTEGAKESACKSNHKIIIQKVKANQTLCELENSINILGEYDWKNNKLGQETKVDCSRGFYTIGPVSIRMQDTFGMFHKEKEVQVYDDFLVFPKMEDLKDTFVKSKVPKIFTGAVNIRQPGPGSEFYSLRDYYQGDEFRSINWKAYARSGKLMINERERDAVSDIILIVDSRSVAETGPVSRNALVYSTRAAASLAKYFLSRRDSVGLVVYGNEIVSVDRDTGKKQLYVILTKLAGAMARGEVPLQVVVNRILPHINKGSPIIVLSNLESDPTIVNALRDVRARDFDVTVLSPSSLEFEFDARRLDSVGYEVLKTERDVLISELRAMGVFICDWEPDMLLSTALAGARGF